MQRRLVVPLIALIATLLSSPLARAQARLPGAVYDFDKKGEKPGPAPKQEISGIWEPARGPAGGIQGKGAAAMESCKRDKPGGKYSVEAAKMAIERMKFQEAVEHLSKAVLLDPRDLKGRTVLAMAERLAAWFDLHQASATAPLPP